MDAYFERSTGQLIDQVNRGEIDDALVREMETVLATLSLAGETGRLQLGLKLAEAYFRLHDHDSANHYAQMQLEAALQSGQYQLAIEAHYLLSLTAGATEDQLSSQIHLADALSLSRKHCNQEMVVQLLLSAGILQFHVKQYELAKHNFEEAVAKARMLGAREVEASGLSYLAAIATPDDRGEAARLYEECLAAALAADASKFIILSLTCLGEIVEADGDNERAQNYYERALQAASEADDVVMFAYVHGNLLGLADKVRGL
jgi:tetratricopeptide (TPR) repeat protein